jgi:F-type H+-transporting ATPase subunit alpha
MIIWAATTGKIDDVPVENVRRFEAELQRFVENSHPGLLSAIREKKALDDEIKADLEQALNDFRDRWTEETNVAARPATTSTAAPTPATGQTTAAGA